MKKFFLIINTVIQNRIFVALAPLEVFEKNFCRKFSNEINSKRFHKLTPFCTTIKSDKGKLLTGFARGDKFYKKNIFAAKSDRLLSLIDKILKSGKVEPGAIGGIIVVTGPGSFTAVRQGVVLANTFSYILKIPVVGVRADEFKNDDALLKIGYEKIKKVGVGGITLPFYGREPNITTPKPKL